MNSISFKYKILIPVLFCFFLSSYAVAQETKQDTIPVVKKYQSNAVEALENQDFETAIVNLNKANKLLSSSTDNLLKAEILISVSELNYSLHNFEKAAKYRIDRFDPIIDNGLYWFTYSYK